MKSARSGKHTLSVEVTNISRTGFWMLLDGRELFLPFERFPWFTEVPLRELLRVERPHTNHLFWPGLDIDLDVESIEHPERFPLVSRVRPNNALQRTAARATRLAKQGARHAARR